MGILLVVGEDRREFIVLVTHLHSTILYKILHGSAPSYLTDLIPQAPVDRQRRSARALSQPSLPPIQPRLETYSKSFSPQTINNWNSLSANVRTAPTLSSFKRLVLPAPPSLSFLSKRHRRASIIYTQLKHNCSQLNAHRYQRHIITTSPNCECASTPETTKHFFFDCTFYDTQREKLIFDMAQLDLPNFSTQLLLDPSVFMSDLSTIGQLQDIIYTFILSSGRF